MSKNLQGHLIKIKVGDEWTAIPVSVINVYNVYVTYCLEHNITPVTESTYYKILGNLENYVQQLTGLNDLAGSVTELTAALAAGALPVDKGGTGQAFIDEADLIQWFKNKLNNAEQGENVNELVSAAELHQMETSLKDGLNTKLPKSDIQYGTDTPSPNKEGLLYFQYSN